MVGLIYQIKLLMSFKLLKLTLLILAAIAVPLVILLVHFNSVQADEATYKLAGWIWTENYGWISMNSENPEFAAFEIPPSSPYQATVTGDDISGWGWSSSVGWVCFGSTCDPSSNDPDSICERWRAATTTPCNFGSYLPSGWSWEAKINSNHTITGVAKVIALNDTGLIRLGMGVQTSSYQRGEQCYDCKASCAELTPYPDPETGVVTFGQPCVRTSTTAFDSCNVCFTHNLYNGVKSPSDAVDPAPGGSGNTCFECGSIDNKCNKSIENDPLSPIVCPACTRCYLFGGAKDDSNGMLLGWAWNGNENASGGLADYGAGWIQLNPTMGGVGIVYPWLQTQYGTVFGQKGFAQKSSISGFNSTYCIFAESVANFKSEKCATTYSGIALKFPFSADDENVYRNALGNLDLKGLMTVANSTGGSSSQDYNKYGNMIEKQTGSNIDWSQPKNFNNQVNIVNGNLTLRGGFKVMNGSGNKKGNGIVIVNGDLTIESDFDYETNAPTEDLRQLASIAWVVKGDIIVKSNVKNIVGAFIALGSNNQVCSLSGSKYPLNHCGVFDSGTNGTPSIEDKSLKISGLLMAKAFNFLRTYSSISIGSEQIVYDGRLSANPPPGLKGLIEALPLIRDFQY